MLPAFEDAPSKTPVSASVDKLKGELSAARQQADAARREARSLEDERQKLVQQVVNLEAQRRQLNQEVDHWRTRCLGFEQECANLAGREDSVQAKLREAHGRERELAIKCIEGRIYSTEAENVQAKAQAEARSQTWQAHQLENKLIAKETEVEALREKNRDANACAEASRVEADNLRAQVHDIKLERDQHKEALVEAKPRHSALEERIQSLEVSLQEATKKQIDSDQEAAKQRAENHSLEETNRRLRLDLQEALSQAIQAREEPLYSGGTGRFQAAVAAVPACVEDLKETQTLSVWKAVENDLPKPLSPSPQSPHSTKSPRSRIDYPRSAECARGGYGQDR
jgi:chromosome segregation ATPase